MLFDLSGKTAVVTGGSRGIGLMAARGLLDAGARTYIAARNQEACEQAAEELASHGDVIPLQADLGTPEGVQAFAQEIAHRETSLHVLVNNAAAAWAASVDDFPVTGWDKVMNLNLKAPFFLTQSLLPQLQVAGTFDDPSRVINVGSIDGIRIPPMPTLAYSASKAGLHHLTRGLAIDLGPRHITVNAIAPGPFESKMMESTLDVDKELFEATAPMRRIGRSEDIEGAVVYLSSRAASYVTGIVLPVDGGLSQVPEARKYG